MAIRLDCAIYRDLLPSYVDGLTSDATNQALEEHLAGCTDCSAALQRMKEPEPQLTSPVAEVDYLKKVRRRTNRKSLLIGVALMLLGMVLLSYRYFYVGSEAAATEVACHVAVTGDTVSLSGTLSGSGLGVSRVTFSDSNGMVQFKVYTVPKAFFNSGYFSETYTASRVVGQVRIGNLIIWEDGTEIASTTAQLFAAVNPYVGDMPSNERIASILGVGDQLGPYTNELKTSKEPYGWTLNLEMPIAQDEQSAARDIMTADSYAMLAAIGNLGYVTWQYRTEAGLQEYTVTAEDATTFAGQDIKRFRDSASQLQTLMQSLSIKWSGVRETLQEEGTFRLNIRNESDERIYGIAIEYYLNGESIGSRGFGNADNSALTSGDDASFEFIPADFPSGTTAIKLTGFSFDLSVIGSDGNQTPVCEGMKVSAKYAWTFFYTLSGNKTNGFVLNAG